MQANEAVSPPLQLVQEIPLWVRRKQHPSGQSFVEGRVDHFSCDPSRKLLFVACLGEDCVLVVDAFAGTVVHEIRTPANLMAHLSDEGDPRARILKRPQGVLYVAPTQRLYVANAGDGKATQSQSCMHPNLPLSGARVRCHRGPELELVSMCQLWR